MPSDLVGGGYRLYDPLWTAMGRTPNATQGNVPVYSNANFMGFGAFKEVTVVTGKQYLVPVPVDWGQSISKISLPIGATEGEAGSETFVALYTGAEVGKEAKLITQGTAVTGAVKKEAVFTQALKETVLASTVNAPNGYLYASYCTTATTLGKPGGWTVEAKVQIYLANAPILALIEAAKAATEAAAAVKVEIAKGAALAPAVYLT